MTRFLIAFLCLCVVTTTNAQLYKCKRADGSSTFQDSECPDGTTSTKIAAPASVNVQSLILTADTLGHYRTQVSINNVSVQGIIDTGASMVTISSATAHMMNIMPSDGKVRQLLTANGSINTYIKTIPVLRVGNVEIYNVEVSITENSPTLIGMSALKNFKINQENEQLVLIKK